MHNGRDHVRIATSVHPSRTRTLVAMRTRRLRDKLACKNNNQVDSHTPFSIFHFPFSNCHFSFSIARCPVPARLEKMENGKWKLEIGKWKMDGWPNPLITDANSVRS
jgi:hypothetical protein